MGESRDTEGRVLPPILRMTQPERVLTKGTPTVLGIQAKHAAQDAGSIRYTASATRRAHRTGAREKKEGETGEAPRDRNHSGLGCWTRRGGSTDIPDGGGY